MTIAKMDQISLYAFEVLGYRDVRCKRWKRTSHLSAAKTITLMSLSLVAKAALCVVVARGKADSSPQFQSVCLHRFAHRSRAGVSFSETRVETVCSPRLGRDRLRFSLLQFATWRTFLVSVLRLRRVCHPLNIMKRPGEADAAPRKRSKTIARVEAEPDCKRFKGARLPDAILALPHVVKSIDVLLMTDVEAIVEAAGTGQLQWMRTLLEKFGTKGWGEAIVDAATTGVVEAVTTLTTDTAMDIVYKNNIPTRLYVLQAMIAAAYRRDCLLASDV